MTNKKQIKSDAGFRTPDFFINNTRMKSTRREYAALHKEAKSIANRSRIVKKAP